MREFLADNEEKFLTFANRVGLLQDKYYKIHLDKAVCVNRNNNGKEELKAKCLGIKKKLQETWEKLSLTISVLGSDPSYFGALYRDFPERGRKSGVYNSPWPKGCAIHAIQMLLRDQGNFDVKDEKIAKDVKYNKEIGSYPCDILDALKENGFVPPYEWVTHQTIDDLRQKLLESLLFKFSCSYCPW